MTRQELAKLAESAGFGALDDLVHEAFSRAASCANSQIENLIDLGWSIQTIESEVREILERKRIEDDAEHRYREELEAHLERRDLEEGNA